jgi:transcriptional/translational regulatory protein YebC/TACO1
VADLRYILDRHEGNLGTSGSVAWQFDRKGHLYVDGTRYHEDAVFEAAIEAGAEDVVREGDEFVVVTDPGSFHDVQEGMKGAGVEFSQAELTFVAKNEVAVAGPDAERLLKLLDELEEHDDVQKVHSNADIDEAVLAEAG